MLAQVEPLRFAEYQWNYVPPRSFSVNSKLFQNKVFKKAPVASVLSATITHAFQILQEDISH